MKAKIYNTDGKENGSVELPETVFGTPWNADLVHQVVISMQANARTPVAHTHDRSEQRGGGKKPWKQKGTGRARHGSRRSPIWRGGGVTFGPRNEKDYSKKINKKMRASALYSVLSRKLKDNEILFIDSVAFTEPKTSEAKGVLSSLSALSGFEGLITKKKNAVLLTLPEKDESVFKSFRNMGNVSMHEVRNLNPVDVLSSKYLIISNPSEAISVLESKRGLAEKKNVLNKKDPIKTNDSNESSSNGTSKESKAPLEAGNKSSEGSNGDKKETVVKKIVKKTVSKEVAKKKSA